MARNFYVTREEVYDAMDFKASLISAKRIDSAIAWASRGTENLVDRKFYPQIATKSFDTPFGGVLHFEMPDMLVSVSGVVSGATVISPSDYFVEPINYGPPFDRLELDRSSGASFVTQGTTQNAVAVSGVWGYDFNTEVATELVSSPNSSTTLIDVKDSAAVGIGNLLVVNGEYMEVVEKVLIDTGQNSSALSAQANATSITGITAGTIFDDEVIQIDSEQMRVLSVAGTTVTVQRAYGGTVLSAHALNADIYAYRRLSVARGINGSTPTSHSATDVISKVIYPADIVELCLAEALTTLSQRLSGYGRTIGSGDNLREAKGSALAQMRSAVVKRYRRYKIA